MDFPYITQYSVTPLHADCFGRCKPSSLLRFAQDAAGEHCIQLGVDWDAMAAKNCFWAVIRQRMEVSRLPKPARPSLSRPGPCPPPEWPIPAPRKVLMRQEILFSKLSAFGSLWT